jgi:hypothetical protein
VYVCISVCIYVVFEHITHTHIEAHRHTNSNTRSHPPFSHTHTHTHTYIYIYIYKLAGPVLDANQFTRVKIFYSLLQLLVMSGQSL